MLVHAEEDGAVLDAVHHLQAAVLAQARQVLRARVEHEVHLARQQRRHARGGCRCGLQRQNRHQIRAQLSGVRFGFNRIAGQSRRQSLLPRQLCPRLQICPRGSASKAPL